MFVAWSLLLFQMLLFSPVLLVEPKPEPAVLQAILIAIELKAYN